MPEVITAGESMAVITPMEAGPLRYVRGFQIKVAGAESNTAIGLCKLGHTAGWISRLGDDEMGQLVCSAVRAEGVDTEQIRWDSGHRTGLMLKEMGSRETKVFYYRENSAASHLSPKDLSPGCLDGAKLLHLTGITPVLSQSCAETVETLAAMAAARGIPMSFDPNLRKKLWGKQDFTLPLRSLLFRSQIVLMGLEEAAVLLETAEPAAAVRLLAEKGVQWVALKNGAKGAWVAHGGKLLEIPPFPCRCVDTVGAGDAFNAGFLAGILEGRELAVCGRMGSIAGAMATEVAGDTEGIPSARQMEAYLQGEAEICR